MLNNIRTGNYLWYLIGGGGLIMFTLGGEEEVLSLFHLLGVGLGIVLLVIGGVKLYVRSTQSKKNKNQKK